MQLHDHVLRCIVSRVSGIRRPVVKGQLREWVSSGDVTIDLTLPIEKKPADGRRDELRHRSMKHPHGFGAEFS
jgi:hypothetical protein